MKVGTLSTPFQTLEVAGHWRYHTLIQHHFDSR